MESNKELIKPVPFIPLFDGSHQKTDVLRVGERGHMEEVHKGLFLSFRAEELHTLGVTNWFLIFTLSTYSSVHYLKLLWSSSLTLCPRTPSPVCVTRGSVSRTTNCSKHQDSTCKWQILTVCWRQKQWFLVRRGFEIYLVNPALLVYTGTRFP